MIKGLVGHSTTVLLAMLCIFIFGLQSYNSLPREAAPDIPIPVVMVTTPYIGVAPADIEGLVSIPMENELASLKDVKKMTSASAEGVSLIYIEFEPDVVIEDALQQVRDRVNRARPKLPGDVEEPSVQEISFSDMPIMLVTIAGDLDEEELKKLAEDMADEATRIPGVLEANVTGGLTREIRVQVNPDRLAHYSLGLSDVVNAISNENSNIPGGNVTVGEANFLLRVPGEFSEPWEIEDVAIKRRGGSPVFVRDLARVVDGYEDRATYSRMDGQPAVTLAVTKRTGANIVEVADNVKLLAAEHAERWPVGVSHRVLADQSVMIRNMVSDLENNIATALILVVGVILFFMGARNSLFVAVAIPLSMLMSFLVIEAIGFTLNMIVLFSLILALGMLVDNAIVVVENVYRHMEEGKDIITASIDGTREVAIAVAASTATTVAAFFPLVFWTGIMGEFMGFLPKTLIIVLVASLVVAVFMLPVLTSKLLKAAGTSKPADTDEDYEEGELNPVMATYRSLLIWSIDHRYISAMLGSASLIVSFIAYGFLNHGTEFFPDTDPNRATVSIRAPEGTDLEATDRIVRKVEAILADEANVDVFVAEVGVGGGGGGFGASTMSPNEARITVDFLPDRNSAEPGDQVRVEATPLTVDRIRERVSEIPGAAFEVAKEQMGPPVGKPINVEVSGEHFDEVGALALKVQRELAKIPGTTDLSNNYRVGRPELRLRIDRGAAQRVGLSTGGIGNAVRTAVAGGVATTLRKGEDEYDVVVELAPEHRDNLQSVLDLRLPGREDTSPNTFPVPLSVVASYELAGGSGSIQHIDQDLIITIEGDVAVGYNANAVQADIQAFLDEYETPEGFYLRMGGSNQEQKDAQEFLGRAFLLAVALILMVLVTQFDSLSIPAIIMATVVLSLVGVLWGLILTGTAFGVIMTGIGVISLAGVVVNNAIVLLDYVEQLRERGLEVNKALIRAGMTRFRPVMLTAITTILGLVPMALGISFDFREFKLLLGGSSAQFWGPMAVAVIFGLAFATVLTLVLVPTLYSIKEDLQGVSGRVFSRLSPGAATTAKVLLLGLAGGGALLVAAPARAQSVVTLDQAYAAAERDNLDLALVSETTRQAELRRGLAWAALSPKLIGSATYTVNEFEVELDFTESIEIPEEYADFISFPESDPIIIQPKEFWQATATLSQPLFNASSLSGLLATYDLAEAARLDESHTRQQVRYGVARAYYGLAAARTAEDLAAGSLETARGQLELASRQVSAGLADRRAQIQAELSVARAERELAAARERVIAAESGFSRATGLPGSSEVVFPESPRAPSNLDSAISDARANRTDLEAAGRRIDASRRTRNGWWLNWAPTLDGNFTYLYNENTGFVGEEVYWMASLKANWVLWDGGARIAQAGIAASQMRAADLAQQRAWQQIEEDLRVAWEAYARAERSIASVERELELATENLSLARRAFEAGSVTWLEVDQAELALRAAQLSELNERMNRDLAALQLSLASGSLAP
jgi:multidrug efflux pump